MFYSTGRHLDQETAEKYSLKQLSARNVVEAEMHLLICETCREAVTACDSYVAAMRNAAGELRKAEQKKPKGRGAGK